MSSLKTQAIQKALNGDWNTAISLNQELLKENPDDIETLNRLAFAYGVLGKVKVAKTTYQKVLHLDNVNSIALRGLSKLQKPQVSHTDTSSDQTQLSPHFTTTFLEESGKTKVIELVNAADPKIISRLRTGEMLMLHVKRLKVFIQDLQKQYIGMLPDDIGKRLIKFIKGGNMYEVYVKGVHNNQVSVFIKEVKRASRFKNHPSFIPPGKGGPGFAPTSKDYSRPEPAAEESTEEEA